MKPLAHQSISALKQVFRQGRPIAIDAMSGDYRGEPAGPWWFRLNSGPTLALSGFGGWLGKRFMGKGQAVNLFSRSGQVEQQFPMTLALQPSQLDGAKTLTLLYPKSARAPWCWVTDELREMPDGSILGMTFVDAPILRHFVFPFVLKSGQA